jgi:hypothetical protein
MVNRDSKERDLVRPDDQHHISMLIPAACVGGGPGLTLCFYFYSMSLISRNDDDSFLSLSQKYQK